MAPALEAEVEAYLRESGVRPSSAKQYALELHRDFITMNKVATRGKYLPSLGVAAKPGVMQRRLPAHVVEAAREALDRGSLMRLQEAEANAALGLPPPISDQDKLAAKLARLIPTYRTHEQVMGYVVGRFPAEYSIVRRVLAEASALVEAAEATRQPRTGTAPAAGGAAAGGLDEGRLWRPREVMVYGAGTGAAVAAALESLPLDALTSVVAVEPATLRQVLGSRFIRRLVAGEVAGGGGSPDTGSPRPEAAGPSAARGDREAAAGVPGAPRISWVGALPRLSRDAAKQRQRYDVVIAAYQLWCTPTDAERMRLVQELWERCGDTLVIVEAGTPRGFEFVSMARDLVLGTAQRQARRKRRETPVWAAAPEGAHVVAPCTHDGRCPMQERKNAWCHFSQRHIMPSFAANALGVGKGRRGDRLEEEFSYVVIRRGPRPDLPVAVARDFRPETGAGLAPPVTVTLPTRAVLNQVALNRRAAAAARRGASAAASTADGSKAGGPAAAVAGPDGGASPGAVCSAFSSRYPDLGPGFVNRLMKQQVRAGEGALLCDGHAGQTCGG
ncbi:hypothetical protein HYH03_012715 [Edaphochlamys debaryana]|uniref:Uncharacterized protein n=1 Tax=Edaphochlamys debaryana TaxID=47281 RepID=A0A835XS76_9CHLO|nr:hypothetical protein HYH03_012715 [Edaphochlamys debaryana]|eukprot:KAG2488715.1 hypothetical protein HYH03_012715 [Edaphochlamys debaryana]